MKEPAKTKSLPGTPFGSATYRLRSTLAGLGRAALAAAWRCWNAFRLEEKFLIAAGLAVGISMAVLGYWIEKRMRASWIQGMAETGALYLQGFLSPHLQALDGSHPLPEENRDKIRNLLVNTPLGDRVAIIKLWDLNGYLIFSSNKTASHEKLHPGYIDRIKAGKVVVDEDTSDHVSEIPTTDAPHRLIEIYAPIYTPQTRNIIAIGEFYEYDKPLIDEIRYLKFVNWISIFIVFIVIIGFLYFSVKKISSMIVRQQTLLESNLARAGALIRRNNALRQRANRARLNAVLLNESYLASVGADLHDGPIQMLSLMMLKLPRSAPRSASDGNPGDVAMQLGKELEPLIQQTLADLRSLSAGLVLPEVDLLSTMETIDLAITRHEQQTGTTVARDMTGAAPRVPSAVRICAYRVVQEALNNAYKHAGGREQKVTVVLSPDMIQIKVTDRGDAREECVSNPAPSTGLGLRGMESRIKSLRGNLSVHPLESGGMAVQARLPLRS